MQPVLYFVLCSRFDPFWRSQGLGWWPCKGPWNVSGRFYC